MRFFRPDFHPTCGFLWKKDYFNSPLILFYLQTFSVNIHITNPDFFF